MLNSNKKIDRFFVVLLLIFLISCNQHEVRFFENDSRSKEKRILRWEKKKGIITIDFMKMNANQCYEIYERLRLKRFENVIALRQNGFWIPYLYFDQSKAAIFGSSYTNYTRFIRNELFGTTEEGFVLIQERENLDGEIDFFYMHYSNELVPISLERFDSLKIYQRGKEIYDPKLCLD
jgi:hypothetical protein